MVTSPAMENQDSRKESPIEKTNAHTPELFRSAPSHHLQLERLNETIQRIADTSTLAK